MLNDVDEERPELHEGQEEGGPIKSFLEHLEDLRWVLIKSVIAVGVAMIVALIACDKVIVILERPLKKAKIKSFLKNQSLTVQLGTNVLGSFNLETNRIGEFEFGTNTHAIWRIEPVASGTNFILAVRSIPADLSVAKAEEMGVTISTFGPAAGFFVAFKVAFYAGIVVASPLLFFFIGGFVFPALKMHEKKHVYRGVLFGGTLFFTGVSFCYFILLPLALRVSTQYSSWLGFSAEIWRAEEYLSFVCKFMLGMGLGFEMPVVLLTLVKIGVLYYRMLAGFRRYMIVVNLILGAVLTTPEVVTQVLMFVPLQLLYELSVWVAWYWERQDRKREEQVRERT